MGCWGVDDVRARGGGVDGVGNEMWLFWSTGLEMGGVRGYMRETCKCRCAGLCAKYLGIEMEMFRGRGDGWAYASC